jgi:uncharacterized protein YndB with AHSA1/START domain
MTKSEKTLITIEVKVNAPIEIVWSRWTDPFHIIHWNNASDDWHTTYAENNLRTSGKFLSRMEAKDGSFGFDFTGKYTRIEPLKQIEYSIIDGRKVTISFVSRGKVTTVSESFEAEQTNAVEMQKAGWQSIMNNFKKYTESHNDLEVLHFEISINTKADKVFSTMLDEEKYKEWTAEFNPTSHFSGSWKKGSKILFLGTDSAGNMGGMVSKVRENIAGRFLSIEHLGIVKDGKEILSGPEVDGLSGILENYTFTELNGTTLVEVDIDSNMEFKSYLSETWPRALNKLKFICEKKY